MKINSQVWGKARTEIIDIATGEIVGGQDWSENLVFDSTLNLLAGQSGGFAGIMRGCKIGSDNTPNKIASGAITFTQAGTAVTASGNFFTTAMIGAILKYGSSGSAGAEYYITAVISGTAATVATAASVVVGTAATVWIVQQTGLTSFLYATNTYDSTAGNCSTTFGGNQATLLQTYVFPAQTSSYAVNEIGYASDNSNNASCNGRIVLSGSDSVSPTQYYRVQITLTFNQSPGSPLSVANVGTGLNTAGTFAVQVWDCTVVPSSGGIGEQQNYASNWLDIYGNGGRQVAFHTVNNLAANVSISSGQAATASETYFVLVGSFSGTGQAVGVGVSNTSFAFTTGGETLYGFVFGTTTGGVMSQAMVHILTTPFTLPSGSFSGSFTITIQFSRTLTN